VASPHRSPGRETSFAIAAIRRREADLAQACATAAVHVRDTRVAGTLAELVFEHVRHARPHCECLRPSAPDVDNAELRSRAERTPAFPATVLDAAVDRALAAALAREHAKLALFIDDACASLLIAPVEREWIRRVALCTAALGESLEKF
jgi:hypothetical protein